MIGFSRWQQFGIRCLIGKPGTKEPAEKYIQKSADRTSDACARLDELLEARDTSIILPLYRSHGLIAIDIDADDNGIIRDTLPMTPLTRLSLRCEARIYRYVTHPDLHIPATLKLEGNGISVDIKSPTHQDGVAPPLLHLPPSVHESGIEYTWQDEIWAENIEGLDELPELDLLVWFEELRLKGIACPVFSTIAEMEARPPRVLETPTETKVAYSEAMLATISADCSYQDWLKTLFALRDELGHEGKEMAIEWSKQSSKWDDKSLKSIDYIWDHDPTPAGAVATLAQMFHTAAPAVPVTTPVMTLPPSGAPMSSHVPVDITAQARSARTSYNNQVAAPARDPRLYLGAHDYEIAKVMIDNNIFWDYAGLRYYDGTKWMPLRDVAAEHVAVVRELVAQGLNWRIIDGRTAKAKVPKNEDPSKPRGRQAAAPTQRSAKPVYNLTMRMTTEVRVNIKGVASQRHANTKPNTWICSGNGAQVDPSWIVPLQNGLLDCSGPTPTLMPFNRCFTNVGTLPFRYDPSATNPWWDEAVGKYFEPAHKDVHIRELYKLMAYVLFPKLRNKKMFVFWGPAGGGKSWLLNILCWLVGPEFAISSDRSAMRGSFATAGMDTAKLLSLDDYRLDNMSGSEVELFKAIVGGTAIRIKEKYEVEHTAVPTCVPVFSTNEVPKNIRDVGGGLADRFIFYYCNPLPMGERLSHAMIEYKMKEALPHILNEVLRIGVRALRDDGESMIQPPGQSAMYVEMFKIASQDTFDEWDSAGGIVPDDTGIETSNAEIMLHYREWIELTYPQEAREILATINERWIHNRVNQMILDAPSRWSAAMLHAARSGQLGNNLKKNVRRGIKLNRVVV